MKTFRPANTKKIKLKKSKLKKQYRLYELSKRQKKQKAYNPGESKCEIFATYTKKDPFHYWKASQKINPKYFCNPTKD